MKGRMRGVALILIGVAALVAAYVGYDHRGYFTPSDAGIVPGAAASSSPSPTATPSALPLATIAAPIKAPAASVQAGPPQRLSIPSIGVNARVISVGVHGGALDIPENPRVLGWWQQGAKPGAAVGSSVIVGHVDSAVLGRGALFHLDEAPVGSPVTVTTSKGVLKYRVVGRRVYVKADLPASVFATNGAPRLVLITCGGPFNSRTRHYRDNIVVYAVPA